MCPLEIFKKVENYFKTPKHMSNQLLGHFCHQISIWTLKWTYSFFIFGDKTSWNFLKLGQERHISLREKL